jgi:membrane-bound lytic murein transglycosylase D
MNRWLLGALGVLTVGCAPQSVRPVPAPTPDQAAPPPPPERPPAEVVAHPALVDSTLKTIAADSVQDQKDQEILDKLHDVSAAPDSGLGTEAEVDLVEMFDINVARYAEHQRVRFYLDFFQGPARERMAVWLHRLPVYEPMIREALVANGLPRDLTYLALIESGYSNTAVSRSRAVGMWQFMRATAREYGMRVDGWVDERRDPIKATRTAARYLADLTKRFGGSTYLAAAAYNGGGGRVSRGLRKLGAGAEEDYFDDDDAETELPDDPTGDDRFFHLSESRYLRRETKDYVPKLIAAAMIARLPEKYGFDPIPEVEPFSVDSVPVTEPTSLVAVAKVSGVDPATITGLNPHFIRGVTPPGSGVWWIRVPVGHGVSTTEGLAALEPSERIPGFAHIVKRRETLRSIGRRYGLSNAELLQFNPKLDGKAPLATGSTLWIPGMARLRALAAAETRSGGPAVRGIHTVRRGETVGGIARRYGMTAAQLRAANELGSSNFIRAGQRLRVGPARSAPRVSKSETTRSSAGGKSAKKRSIAAAPTRAHVVRRGETLSSLARRYGVSVEALMTVNRLRSSHLRAGDRLTIPS